ncbi:MAG TPA: ThiF family adenylyltransferase [Anaerovoracaceae bacterium]|nr:ThiF family adenylyltransferase [Anaerovoracaceae bacterium]
MDHLQRYSRQMAFAGVDEAGQRKLLASRVAVIGLGALGSVISDRLARSGVGSLRLIDRDYIKLSNLQRQSLFDEDDAREHMAKAAAAKARLSRINSEIEIEAFTADVNSSNVENLIRGADIVLDGTDNYEARYLLNEACHKYKIPWIYGGALAGSGAVMSILHDGGPCFRCLYPQAPAAGSYPTCSTSGILSMASGIAACLEAAEAIKILIGSPKVSHSYTAIDIWENAFDRIAVQRNPDCPVCGHDQYEYLGKAAGAYGVNVCGSNGNGVQLWPGVKTTLNLEEQARRLEKIGKVQVNSFMLTFEGPEAAFSLFAHGSAIIQNAEDEKEAKSVYSEYIGM